MVITIRLSSLIDTRFQTSGQLMLSFTHPVVTVQNLPYTYLSKNMAGKPVAQ